MTFSIAGLCERTGDLGLALTTSSMAAGARAMFLAPGYGAVFAQARSDPRLGALGCARLAEGRSAEATLADMLASTDEGEWRQLGVLDAAGLAAHATGERCVASKGAATANGALALGNGLANDRVVPAILHGFLEDPELPLVERLIAAAATLDRDGALRPSRDCIARYKKASRGTPRASGAAKRLSAGQDCGQRESSRTRDHDALSTLATASRETARISFCQERPTAETAFM